MIHVHVEVAKNIKNAVVQIYSKNLGRRWFRVLYYYQIDKGDDVVLEDYKAEVANMINTINEMGASL